MSESSLVRAYRRGRQRGEALISDAGFFKAGSNYFRDAARCLAKLVGISNDELIRRVVAYHRERLDAVPDLTVYPELKGYRDRLDAEYRGLRDAGIDDTTIALMVSLNFWRDVKLLQETGKVYHAVVMPEKCRVVYVPESDVGQLHAKNVDDPLTYWKPRPPHGPEAPWPWQKPVLFDGVGSGLHIDEIPPEIFPVNAVDLARELCNTVAEAQELLVRYNYFWSGQNLLVHDLQGNSVAFEKTRCRVAARGPNERGINFITGMGALDSKISAFQKQQRRAYMAMMGWTDECIDAAFWRICEGTWRNMTGYIAELSLNPTFDNLKQLMEQRDRSGPMCLNGAPCHPDDQAPGCTLVMDIYLLDRKQLHRRQWRGTIPAFLDTPEIATFG